MKIPTPLQKKILNFAPSKNNVEIAETVNCSCSYVVKTLSRFNYSGKRPIPRRRCIAWNKIRPLMHKCTDSEIAFLYNCSPSAVCLKRDLWRIPQVYKKGTNNLTVQSAVMKILKVLNRSPTSVAV